MFVHTTQRLGPATAITSRMAERKALTERGSSFVPWLTWTTRGSARPYARMTSAPSKACRLTAVDWMILQRRSSRGM